MPSTAVLYGSSVTETGVGVAWTNIANVTDAPDDVSASAAILQDESTAIALIDLASAIAAANIPAGSAITGIVLTPRVSDSGYTIETIATIRTQLYNGTTAVGSILNNSTTAAALTTYTTSNAWGVGLSMSLLTNLRVGVLITRSAGAETDVALDSCGVQVEYRPGGGGRSRTRLNRAR